MSDTEIEKYCKEKNIPIESEQTKLKIEDYKSHHFYLLYKSPNPCPSPF